MPAGVTIEQKPTGEFDFAHLFAKNRKQLERFIDRGGKGGEGLRGNFPGTTETNIAAPFAARLAPAAVRRAQAHWLVVPRPAAQDPQPS